MRANRVVLALACALGLGAQAPAPSDQVTVTGEKERKAIEGFVTSLAMPTRLTGKMARWETGICPIAIGLRKQATQFILQRLKDVAVQVDAPVNKSPSCRPNIQIVFTTTPQALLNSIRKKQDAFLGYADTVAQRDALAVFQGPIQAWYLTATRDLAGKTEVDSGRMPGAGGGIMIPCPTLFIPPYLPSGECSGSLKEIRSARPASALLTTGSRALGDGLRSTFHNVIVVADPTKLVELEMGPLSDYIALLALSQVALQAQCQTMPSIVNLLPLGCERQVGLTPADLGYLRGLYHMNAGQMMSGQQSFVAYQMEQALAGQ